MIPKFETSTQARSWMFDDASSLILCKEKAARIVSSDFPCPEVRNFACGFQVSDEDEDFSSMSIGPERAGVAGLGKRDQELLVSFHAHQIQRLVGPNALFPELRRSLSALSTATMLFRRFYLSNSAIAFHPRAIAVASALLAVKVECELRLEIRLLSTATSVVNSKAQGSPIYADELTAVSPREIEKAERQLLVGLDFRLACHHPYQDLEDVVSVVMAHSKQAATQGLYRDANVLRSPTRVDGIFTGVVSTVRKRATAIAQSALVYTDVHFLFSPRCIAFASAIIALQHYEHSVVTEKKLRSLIQLCFTPQQNQQGFKETFDAVPMIITRIENCPSIDLDKGSRRYDRCNSKPTQQASNLRRIFRLAASRRSLVQGSINIFSSGATRRKRRSTENCYPHYQRKVAKMTPVAHDFFCYRRR